MILQGLLSGHFVNVALKLCVVVSDWVGFRLFENTLSAVYDQLPSLLQKLTNLLPVQLLTLVCCRLLHRLVNLVKVRHLGFDSHLLDRGPVTISKGVYPIL